MKQRPEPFMKRLGLAFSRPMDRVEDVPREVTTCRTMNEVHSRVVGYRVTSECRGQQFTTLMRDNPGPGLRVRASVDPV
jgi:uncharacterized protein YcfJ